MNNNPAEFLNDFLPRAGIAREGWWRIGVFGAGSLLLNNLRKAVAGKPDADGKRNPIRTFLAFWLGLARNAWSGLFAYALFYYRDPGRDPVGNDPECIYAPVDGRLVSIEEVEEPKFIGGKAHCLTFETKLFDVKIQRAPIEGQLRYLFIEMQPEGRVNYLGFAGPDNRRASLVQSKPHLNLPLPEFLNEKRPATVRVEAGTNVRVGQKIGVSGFGLFSRAQLFLPADESIDLVLRLNQTNRAGMTVLGRFRRPLLTGN